MLHEISPNQHGPLTKPMTHAIETCVHCGFCLAVCPTYQELGQEMDSPRGRIVLMKEVLEGKLSWTDAQPHVDRCLGCLACEPACPSGVPYRDLISPFRAVAQSKFQRSSTEKLARWLSGQTLPYPSRFRTAAATGRVGKLFSPLLPASLKSMLELLPAQLPPKQSWPEVSPAKGERRARVALLIGCAQQVLDPDINTATIEVLTRNGVEVIVPRAQGCCGGLAWHEGALGAAQDFARRNLAAFPDDVDAILTNAAGCGSAMHEYHLVLAGTPDEARAEKFRHRVMDVSVFLQKLGLREKPPGAAQVKVAYHDSCHLANAQNVRREPRELLRAIPGVSLAELTNAHLCCGSAGSYNVYQPGIAASLGEQKAQAVIATGASVVVSGNIGCLTQLKVHLAKLGSPIVIRHTLQVLRDAYETPRDSKNHLLNNTTQNNKTMNTTTPPPPAYGPSITLDQARKISAAAQEEALRNGWRMVVSVMDAGGHVVLLERMDGAQFGSVQVAQDKARSAVAFRRPTKAFHDMVAAGGEGVRMLVMSGAVPIDGGLPILVGGAVIGGIGLSGGTSAQDGQVAAAGLAALAS